MVGQCDLQWAGYRARGREGSGVVKREYCSGLVHRSRQSEHHVACVLPSDLGLDLGILRKEETLWTANSTGAHFC